MSEKGGDGKIRKVIVQFEDGFFQISPKTIEAPLLSKGEKAKGEGVESE